MRWLTCTSVHLLKDVGELCEELGFEGTCKHVVPFLERSIEDAESVVRQALAEELVAVCYRLLVREVESVDGEGNAGGQESVGEKEL